MMVEREVERNRRRGRESVSERWPRVRRERICVAFRRARRREVRWGGREREVA